MSDIQRIEGNPRMSMAVAHGGIVSLSGQVAIDARGQGIDAQVTEVLARIDALLEAAGTDRSRLLTAQVFIADRAEMPAVNAQWDRWITPGCAPTRTTIQAVLASDDYRLEIAVTAALP